MTPAEDMNPAPLSTAVLRRRARQCRITSLVALLLGLVVASAVYGLQSPRPDYRDDPALAGFTRSEDRQMGILYGKQGQLIEDLNHSMQQPGTQAILILLTAAVVAGGTFFLARVMERRLAADSRDASNLPVGGRSE